MRIDIEITDRNTKKKKNESVNFNILSCVAPTNLWIVLNKGKDTRNHNNLQFSYKKIVSLMEVTATCNNEQLHGQVATIAQGNAGGLGYFILKLKDESEKNTYTQLEFSDNSYETFIIDLDELNQINFFKGKNLKECVKELLLYSYLDYDQLTNTLITWKNGKTEIEDDIVIY